MANSLYYTFSTIAQVLSAFIALSGVFVIFKMQELKKMQFQQIKLFIYHASYADKSGIIRHRGCSQIACNLDTLHKSECLGGMEKEMNNILHDESILKSEELKSLLEQKEAYDNINTIRLHLLRCTKVSIISGLLTIFFSLLILPLVPKIDACISCMLYSIGFLGFLISIGTMVYVIFASLKERDYLSITKPIN